MKMRREEMRKIVGWGEEEKIERELNEKMKG